MDTHDYRIDRLRLLSCLGVVMLHSSTGSGADDLALNALFRFSVPVFVIISGWFQLSGSGSPEKLIRKCGVLVGKLLLWSGLYLAARWLLWDMWPENVAVYLLTEPVHLWYLYAAAGLCLLTPALCPFVRGASKGEYCYALALCFLIGCVWVTLVRLEWLPVLGVILEKSKLPQMVGFLFLYLLGGYFRRFGFGSLRIWAVTGAFCALVGIGISSAACREQLLSFIAPNVVLSGAACFALCMSAHPVSEQIKPFLRRASECTMGIYLLHPLVSSLLTPHLSGLRDVLFPSVYMLLRCCYIFTVTFFLIWILTLVKPLKKFLL